MASLASLCAGIDRPLLQGPRPARSPQPMEAKQLMQERGVRTKPRIVPAAVASLRPTKAPAESLLAFIAERVTQADEFGGLARAIQRDSCFPTGSGTSYVECVRHLRQVHGGPERTLDALKSIWILWMEAWLSTGTYPGGPPPSRLRERQDIFEAAIESGLAVTRTAVAFCWNDVPGSPTQGHFNGNREPSLKLYGDNQTFQCHQCGIWGYSDQLKTRTWQGRK